MELVGDGLGWKKRRCIDCIDIFLTVEFVSTCKVYDMILY